jgi:hypothetical protein
MIFSEQKVICRICRVLAGKQEMHAKCLVEKSHGNRPCRIFVYRQDDELQINHVMESGGRLL